MAQPVDIQALTEWLCTYPDWSLDRTGERSALVARYEFSDFKRAFSFLQGVAQVMEEQNHHAEIYNMYNRVSLTLSTHDAGDVVTSRDLHVAESASALASEHGGKADA